MGMLRACDAHTISPPAHEIIQRAAAARELRAIDRFRFFSASKNGRRLAMRTPMALIAGECRQRRAD